MLEKIMKTLLRWVIALIFLGALGFAGYSWVVLKYVYARGERAGYIQKFSQKGWIIKTWEGELAMMNLPGSMPEIFRFTVRNDDVARKVMDAMSQRVSITYEQHRGLPGRLFGDTSYFVTHAQVVDGSGR